MSLEGNKKNWPPSYIDWIEQTLREHIKSNIKDNGTAEGWMEDLQSGGCESGLVGDLIYTRDIWDLFDEYGTEIFEIAYDYAEEISENLFSMIANNKRTSDQCSDLSGFITWLVWYTFEMKAYEMSDDLIREYDKEDYEPT